MKIVLCCFIIFIFAIQKIQAGPVPCPPCVLGGDIVSDVEITAGQSMFSDNAVVAAAMVLSNNGILNGAVSVDPQVHFSVRNSGVMNAAFHLADNARLYQYISSVDEMARLNVLGGVYIPIIMPDFVGVINAADLLAIYDGIVRVDKEVLDINIKMSELADLAAALNIVGSVKLYIVDYDGRDLVLPSFDGAFFLSWPEIPDQISDNWTENDTLFQKREINYTAVFGADDQRAVFLNTLRLTDPDNRILKNLDRSASRRDLIARMNKTMFFNPMVLNDGIKRMAERADFRNDADVGFYFGMRAVADGSNVGNNFIFGNKFFSVGIYAGQIFEDDDYKHGDGVVYGANAAAYYDWFGFGAKAIFADWKNVLVMTDSGAKTNAASRAFHGFVDFSPDFGYARPVVRLGYSASEIAGRKDYKLRPSVGGRFAFSETKMGVGNRHGIYVMADSRGIDFGIDANWHFIEDFATVSIAAGPRSLSVEFRVGF